MYICPLQETYYNNNALQKHESNGSLSLRPTSSILLLESYKEVH